MSTSDNNNLESDRQIKEINMCIERLTKNYFMTKGEYMKLNSINETINKLNIKNIFRACIESSSHPSLYK